MARLLKPDLTAVEELFLTAVQNRLVGELNDPTTHFQKRVEIGSRLAEIGDCRPGVGLQQNGLPDLLWIKIPGTAAVRDSPLFSLFDGLRLGSGVKGHDHRFGHRLVGNAHPTNPSC